MSDETSRLEHAERELRDTREALNRARAEITQLRGENTDLRAVAGATTERMLLVEAQPGTMFFDHAIGTAYRI